MFGLKAVAALGVASALLLLLAACGSSVATPTPTGSPAADPDATPTLGPIAEPTQPPGSSSSADQIAEAEAYGRLVDRVMNDIGLLAPLLSRVGIQLSGNPEAAPQAAEVVETARDALDLTRAQLAGATPPAGYGGLHRELLDALGFYSQAAVALLPDPETQAADYWRFQELMMQGGKNTHAAGATLTELGRSE